MTQDMSISNPSLLKFLDRIDKESSLAREQKEDKWANSINHWRGEFWPDKRPSYKSSPVLNQVATVLERKVAYLTDTRPQIHVASRDDRIQGSAEILEGVIGALWEERNWTQALQEMLFFAGIFGYSFTSVIFNPELDMGLGDIDIPVGDPRSYGFDPFVLKGYDIDKGEYIVCERFVATEELQVRYPHVGEVPAYYEPEDDSKESRWKSLIAKMFSGRNEGHSPAISRSLVREYWIKDRTLKRDKGGKVVLGPNGSPARESPGGRHILRAGDKILVNENNPYIDGAYCFPVDMLAWRFDPDTAMGMSEVENLGSIQLLYNKLVEIIAENAVLMTNAIWVGDKDALDPGDWNKLSNKPGGFVKVRPGKSLRREGAPALPSYIQNVVMYLKDQFGELSGMNDIVGGTPPGGVTSGVALDSLQQAAQSIIRLKARDVETTLQRIGQKLIARILQYYSSDRIIHLLGSDGNVKQYKFLREELIKPLRKAYNDQGDQSSVSLARRALRDLRFKVVPGSSLAMAKIPKVMMALTLHERGVLDDEDLLNVVDLPNKEEVLEKARQRAMQGNGQPRGGGNLPAGMLPDEELMKREF